MTVEVLIRSLLWEPKPEGSINRGVERTAQTLHFERPEQLSVEARAHTARRHENEGQVSRGYDSYGQRRHARCSSTPGASCHVDCSERN